MRIRIKIVFKFILLIIFLFYTPFFEGMRQLIDQSHFLNMLVVKQETKTESFSLKTQLNVLSLPRQEDRDIVVEQTISTADSPASIPQIEDEDETVKKIYIYDTHQSEEYLEGKTVLDGAMKLGTLLKEKGYDVVVETNSFSDYMKKNGLNYNDSYQVSANFLNDMLVNEGPFDLIIDFHRDAVPRENSFVTIDGKNYARMMFVIGGLSGRSDETQALAQTLYDKIEQIQPGIMKQTMTREAYYNQQMSEHMILIEVGTNNNTFEEVENSVHVLADGIDAYLDER